MDAAAAARQRVAVHRGEVVAGSWVDFSSWMTVQDFLEEALPKLRLQPAAAEDFDAFKATYDPATRVVKKTGEALDPWATLVALGIGTGAHIVVQARPPVGGAAAGSAASSSAAPPAAPVSMLLNYTPSQYGKKPAMALTVGTIPQGTSFSVPRTKPWEGRRVCGYRIGLTPPPLAVTLMSNAFLHYREAFHGQLDVKTPEYARASDAADTISEYPGRLGVTLDEDALSAFLRLVFSKLFGPTTRFDRLEKKTRILIDDSAAEASTAASGKAAAAGAAGASSRGRGGAGVAGATSRSRSRSGSRSPLVASFSFMAGSAAPRIAWTTKKTDGTISVEPPHTVMQFSVLNFENKIIGLAAPENDVYAYSMLSAIEARESDYMQVPAVLVEHAPHQPMFLVDVYCGHLVEVWALAWAGSCMCTESLGVAPLFTAPGSDERDQLVRLLCALAAGVNKLHAQYQAAAAAWSLNKTFVPLPSPELHGLIASDILARVTPAGKRITLTHSITKLVFVGKMASVGGAMAATAAAAAVAGGTDDGVVSDAAPASSAAAGIEETHDRHVVVKFCRTYSRAVHAAVAQAGFAPQLHECLQAGGWSVVVMDFLSPKEWVPLASDARASAADVNLALAAYNEAFGGPAAAAGGRPMVHGDARGPNIFMRKDRVAAGAAGAAAGATGSSSSGSGSTARGLVHFVDFEFAGFEGDVCYPSNASSVAFQPVLELLRAPMMPIQRVDGLPILQMYDRALIQASCRPPATEAAARSSDSEDAEARPPPAKRRRGQEEEDEEEEEQEGDVDADL